jgi:hypothetical protein
MHPAITCKIISASNNVTPVTVHVRIIVVPPAHRHSECDTRIYHCDLTISVEVAALPLVHLSAECVQDIGNHAKCLTHTPADAQPLNDYVHNHYKNNHSMIPSGSAKPDS